MRIKKLLTTILVLSVVLLGVFSGNITKAEEITEEKIYCNATIEDNFTDNEVLVVLTNEESLEYKEYTINDFSEINCVSIEDLTDGYKDKIEQQLNGTYTGNMPVNLETFNRILKLILPINSKQNVLDSIDILEDRNDVISVEPVYLVKAESLESTEVDYYSDYEQWAHEVIGFNEIKNMGLGNRDIKIGIIDTGISKNLFYDDDLDSYNSKAFGNNQDPFLDPTGHGTMVASVIAGVDENQMSIGLCCSVSIVSLKVSSTLTLNEEDVYLDVSAIANAIEHADTECIPIINLSLGIHANEENQGIMNTLNEGMENYTGLAICSAGNYRKNNDINPHYPSGFNYNNIISVGASNENDELWNTSGIYGTNYGSNTVDLFAPGENIVVANRNGSYTIASGTSLAAPFVAGTAALLLMMNNQFTISQLKEIILSSVDIGVELNSYNNGYTPLNGKCVTGGRLNLYKAYLHATHYNDLFFVESLHTYIYTPYNAEQHFTSCFCGYETVGDHEWIRRPASLGLNNTLAIPMVYMCIKCEFISF